MARVEGIKKRLEKNNIEESLVKEITSGDLVDVIIKMDKLLDPDLAYTILDSQACGTSAREINGIKKIAAETLSERIEKISGLEDFHSSWDVRLNQDNTLTAGWVIKENDAYACVCSAAVKKGVKVSELTLGDRAMPLTYCFCCAGHCRRHLEKLLGVELKTKEIVSSPINSKGRIPCEFIFKIL
jgi:succinate dehydrogenase/fumarate reductase-like Fe-S protein